MGGILPRLTLLMPAFSLPSAPPDLTIELHGGTERSPTPSPIEIGKGHGFGGRLSPVTLSARDSIDQ